LNRLFRPRHRPWGWLALWILGLALVATGSLLPSHELPRPLFPGIDKLHHLLGHGALSAYAAALFAPMRARLAAAAGLLLFGIGLELAQHALTATRGADPADVAANALGIVLGQLLGLTRVSAVLERLDARLHA
jgi:VanZ family protein